MFGGLNAETDGVSDPASSSEGTARLSSTSQIPPSDWRVLTIDCAVFKLAVLLHEGSVPFGPFQQ